MKEVKRVYSVASHGGEYLFYVIEAVVLLNHDKPADTTITFLPFEPPFASLIKRVRSLVARDAPRASVGPRHPPNNAAVYTQLQSGREVRIQRNGYAICLQRRRLSHARNVALWLTAAARAWRVWWSCYHQRRFQPLSFLRAHYKGVQVGDLAASMFFRTNLSADEPRPVPALFFMLWWACYLIDVTEALVDTREASSFFTITPEPNYVHSAPYRYLRKQGFTGLDIYQPNTPLLTLPAGEDIALPRKLHRLAGQEPRVLPTDIDELVADYFEERLHVASKLLWYMSHGHNDNLAADIVDHKGQPVALDADGLYATIFLHSFADGQYFFGVDGFESLGHWTYQTIEACLSNPSFDKVLIKPHPNADYDVHPGDKRALERVIRRYRGNPRVVILSPNASIVKLCSVDRIVGFTHHGSIAEELVYLGQPVLASTFAWWSDQYRFARLWTSPSESAELIARQSKENWRPPSSQEREELYRYLFEFRFREVPCDRTFPAFILARLRNPALAGGPVRLRTAEETMYSRELEALRADDPEFLQLLCEFEQLAVETPVMWPLTRVAGREASAPKRSGPEAARPEQQAAAG